MYGVMKALELEADCTGCACVVKNLGMKVPRRVPQKVNMPKPKSDRRGDQEAKSSSGSSCHHRRAQRKERLQPLSHGKADFVELTRPQRELAELIRQRSLLTGGNE